MSYLQKIAELQSRAEQSRNEARSFQNEVREDAFSTAEAKKEDFLGHIARGVEDLTRKLETAGAIAGTTSAIAKHIKKLRGNATKSKTAPDQEQPKPTPEEEEENPSADSGGADRTGLEDLGFTEEDAKGLFEPAEPAATTAEEAAPRAPLFPEAAEAAGREEAAEQAEASSKATFSEAQKTQMTKPDSQEEAGGEARPADLPAGDAPETVSARELRSEVPTGENLTTEGNVADSGGALAEEGAGDSEKSISSLMDGLSDSVAEGAGSGLGEAVAGGIGDAVLGAIPIIGDLALAASLIGSVVEGAEGAKKEEKAEEEMSPKEPAGVAVATTGIDGKSLLEQ
jgi:hypothetical protein